MSTVTMFDDVNVSLLPPGAAAYGGYVNGLYANADAVRRKFPHAKVIGISVSAVNAGDCLDVERGDATNAQAPLWFKAREGKTATPKPWIYTSASNVDALVATMSRAGIARDRYFIWSAHYTHKAHICSGGACGYPLADGTQWTDKAMGRSLDESSIQAYMLPGAKALSKPVTPTRKPAPAPTHPVITSARGKLQQALNNNRRPGPIRRALQAALKAIRGIK